MGNIRKTDSKKRILKAFIEILNTDGFNKMTVSKITSLAHINRGTFYLNYIDKFDLLEEIEQEIFTKIKTILLEKETIDIIFSDEKILAVISYLQSNAALITALINSDLKNSIQEQFLQKIMLILTIRRLLNRMLLILFLEVFLQFSSLGLKIICKKVLRNYLIL